MQIVSSLLAFDFDRIIKKVESNIFELRKPGRAISYFLLLTSNF